MKERRFSRKFGPNAKQIIAKASPDKKRLVKILLRISGELNPKRRSELQALGCNIRTVATDVVTAELPEGALSRVGKLEYVGYIEVARPLYLEPKDQEA